jgi:predicted Rdx family selenoprotein
VTRCKWMLRAAYVCIRHLALSFCHSLYGPYDFGKQEEKLTSPLTLRPTQYAQELLSTFSTSLGEVALQPSTGGTFVVDIFHSPPSPPAQEPQPGGPKGDITPARTVLWDRKTDGGFPETKELKRRVRDVIEPGRDLGHVDRNHARPTAATNTTIPTATAASASEPKADTESHQQQQPQKERPSRAELEAAGPAGAGYPGASEAAAEAAAAACESKQESQDCKDCD